MKTVLPMRTMIWANRADGPASRQSHRGVNFGGVSCASEGREHPAALRGDQQVAGQPNTAGFVVDASVSVKTAEPAEMDESQQPD